MADGIFSMSLATSLGDSGEAVAPPPSSKRKLPASQVADEGQACQDCSGAYQRFAFQGNTGPQLIASNRNGVHINLLSVSGLRVTQR